MDFIIMIICAIDLEKRKLIIYCLFYCETLGYLFSGASMILYYYTLISVYICLKLND